jgi:proteic killer suppression protein
LEISFKTNKLEKSCLQPACAKKKYGLEMTEKIFKRLNELRAADSVDVLVQYSVGRCHELSGNLSGSFAMDLVHPYRLIFERHKTETGNDCVRITTIEDYH